MIPAKLRKELSEDPWYSKCCYHGCNTSPVEWHHVYQYAGKSIQAYFNIVPACKLHHDQATPHKNQYVPEVRDYFEWIAIQRMSGKDLETYSKKDWSTHTFYLCKKAQEYGW